MLRDFDPATSVVTSSYVMNEGMPVLSLSCEDDEEGGVLWQAHCGNGDYDMEKMLLVRADTLLALDETIGNVDLALGQEAIRDDGETEWKVR